MMASAGPRRHCGSGRGWSCGLLLTEMLRATDLGLGYVRRARPWRNTLAVHHPANVMHDLAVTLTLGGDALGDIARAWALAGDHSADAANSTHAPLGFTH